MSFNSTVESLSKIMDDMGINELELERQFLFGIYRKHIHLSKGQTVAVAAPVAHHAEVRTEFKSEPKPALSEKVEAKIASLPTLNSPMVGVAYLSPEPGAKPFVSVGAAVKSGDTVALIEAMKTFNPIKSNKDGVVKEILVKDGEAVEFDQPIIVIE